MRRLAKVFTALCVAVVVLLVPSAVSAHAVLDSSTPLPSSVLESSPSEIRLDFNETIENSLLSIQLFDSEQRDVSIGKAQRSESDLSVAVASVPRLGNGVYVVVWRAVSADGHPVSGAFPFEIGNTSNVDANELLTRVLQGLETDSPLGGPLAIARFLAYAAVIMLIGCVAFTWGSKEFVSPALVMWLRRSVMAFAVGSLGILLLQGPYAVGRGWSAITDSGLLADVLPTRLGIASVVRCVLAVMWGLLVVSMSRNTERWWKIIALVTALTSVVTFSVSGHASAASLPGVFAVVIATHLVAVSVWVGSFFAAVVIRREESVARLSRLATVAMPVVIITGVVEALHLMDGVSQILDSRYGTYLLLKVAVIGVCLVIGYGLRRRMKSGRPTVTQSLFVEAVLLVAVIAITAFMVGTSPTATASSSNTFSATQIQSDIVADFSILPTRVGAAEIHVYLTPPGGSLEPVDDVLMSFKLPSRDIPSIPVDLIEIGPNHWSGVMQFPYAGEWSMEARVQPQPNFTLLYTATVPIND
ncbi:MAG: copper resistance CopC/CopD family protein [Ilumatobacteraceae bacterium]